MSHGFEFIIEEKLREHEEESERVNTVNRGLYCPAVPGLVRGVDQTVHGTSCK